jgi:hypothetical protein
MRYYDLKITNAAGQIYQPSGNGFTLGSTGTTFTSWANGINIPGALNIEFDAIVYPLNTPQGNTHIKVQGVGLGMISQAAQLAGANFVLSGGMKPGLPLATAAAGQAGILLQGTIYQSYGNWQGADQTLELIVNPGALSSDLEQIILFNWPAGTPLSAAITATINQAFPGYKPTFSITDLTLANTEVGAYDTFWQFAGYLTGLTQRLGAAVNGSQYSGVQITLAGNKIYVYDNSIATTPKMIAFQDLIGQPTWIDALTVNFKTMLRSDIAVGTTIKFPQGIQTPYALTAPSAPAPNAPVSSKTAFQGNFVIQEVHHFCNLRQSDADSWATAFSAVAA